MAFRKLQLDPVNPAPAIAAPVRPLSVLEPDGPHEGLVALDTLMSASRRIVHELGLRGGDRFLVPSVTAFDPGPSDRIYPDATTARVVARGRNLPLAPGHALGLDLVALPSGPTQVTNGSNGWEEGARVGAVRLTVTYANGVDTITQVAEIDVVASGEPNGEPVAPYSNFLELSAIASPLPLNPSATDEEKFTRGVDVVADWILEYIGSPRPVDLAVVEVPISITVDQASARWPSAMYTEGAGPFFELPTDFPVEQIDAADPGAGSVAIRRGQLEHGRELGPLLAQWTSGTEHIGTILDWVSYDTGTGDDEAPPAGQTGTVEFLVPFEAPPFATAPGWCIGHYARQVPHGDDFFDGRTGVLPVWVTAYVRGDAAVYSLRSADPAAVQWSAIEFTSTADAWEWVVIPGWLEIGVSSEDAPILRLYARETADEDATGALVRYLGVHFRFT